MRLAQFALLHYAKLRRMTQWESSANDKFLCGKAEEISITRRTRKGKSPQIHADERRSEVSSRKSRSCKRTRSAFICVNQRQPFFGFSVSPCLRGGFIPEARRKPLRPPQLPPFRRAES